MGVISSMYHDKGLCLLKSVAIMICINIVVMLLFEHKSMPSQVTVCHTHSVWMDVSRTWSVEMASATLSLVAQTVALYHNRKTFIYKPTLLLYSQSQSQSVTVTVTIIVTITVTATVTGLYLSHKKFRTSP